ncbi:MAG: mannitol dehydrogenase family protein [Alphaproteobacteria bacterium]
MSAKLKPAEAGLHLYIPTYAPKHVGVGVVHVGLGAFHRAHQAFYLDSYMEKTGDLSWGIAAVNLRAEDRIPFIEASNKDGYVLKTIATDGSTEHRLVRCHREFSDWSIDADASEDLVAKPETKLVTITVTESGYYLDSDGKLDLSDPLIAQEVSGTTAKSVYAYLRNSLSKRQSKNALPLTIMCCDNLRANGHLLDANFKAYLTAAGDTELLAWVEAKVSFPASMVDRITPKLDPSLSVETNKLFGLEDCQTVLGEDFIQWVVEDKFAAEKPALDLVGVEFTDNVEPYEETKIRILNGGHTCLAYLGALAGFHSFDQLMSDPQMLAHFRGYEQEEVLPALPANLPLDTKAYLQTIERRFSNVNIADTVERICTDGFAKFAIFIRPTLEGVFAAGKVPTYGIRSIASWYVFARRSAQGKLNISYIEPNMERLAPLIADGNLDEFINDTLLWGHLPKEHPEFGQTLKNQIAEMEQSWPA